MKTELLPVTDVKVKERLRYEDDEIGELMESLLRFGGEPRGLLQPIIIDQFNVLQDGFRRFTAACKLGWTHIPVHRRESLSDAEYFEIELETNFRRKQFTWQETIHAVVKIHKMRVREGVLKGQPWTQAMTGELLGGYSDSYVSNCMQLDSIVDGEAFADCTCITDAVKVLYRRKEDEAMRSLASKTKLVESAPSGDDDVEVLSEERDASADEPSVVVPLSKMLHQGDSIRTVLPSWPAESVDHIICDPPYGIDVAMMHQASGGIADVSRIEGTHQVDENENLIDTMFPVMYRVLKPTGFCICFADIMQWQRLYDRAIAAGFKVQRWPFVWHKTSACINQYAQANFTKNIEIAIICRREQATLGRPIQTSLLSCPREETKSNPFAKPFALWQFLIEACTLQGQTILDPFAGEGSSTLAALRTFRRPLAIERDPTHFPYLVENVKQHFLSNFPNATFA